MSKIGEFATAVKTIFITTLQRSGIQNRDIKRKARVILLTACGCMALSVATVVNAHSQASCRDMCQSQLFADNRFCDTLPGFLDRAFCRVEALIGFGACRAQCLFEGSLASNIAYFTVKSDDAGDHLNWRAVFPGELHRMNPQFKVYASSHKSGPYKDVTGTMSCKKAASVPQRNFSCTILRPASSPKMVYMLEVSTLQDTKMYLPIDGEVLRREVLGN